MFEYETHRTDATLEQLLDHYQRTQRAIQVDFRRLVSCVANPDRATHLLHPYPAKLLTHIPFFFLANSILSREGDTVADPFCGSGTVLLESILAGRQGIGADCNPLARLITHVKTCPIPTPVLKTATNRLFERLERDRSDCESLPDVVNLRYWFHPNVIRQLSALLHSIERTRRSDVRDFFRVCFSSCVRKVSLADPRLAVPVRLRHGQYPRGHYLRKKTDDHLRSLRHVNVAVKFSEIVNANTRRMATISSIDNLPTASIVSSEARQLKISRASLQTSQQDAQSHAVQLVITSPPYPGAQKYIRASSLSLGWLGLCNSKELFAYKRRTIGREEIRKSERQTFRSSGLASADCVLRELYQGDEVRATIASTYLREMRDAIVESWNHLCRGGFFVLVAANNQIGGRNFSTQRYLQNIAEDTGFQTILRLTDDIRSRGLMTKRNKTAGVITQETVMLFKKH